MVTRFEHRGIADPAGIVTAPDGALWFTNQGGTPTRSRGSLGRITTSGKVTRYRDPTVFNPLGLTVGPDQALWFTNPSGNSISRFGLLRITTVSLPGAAVGAPYSAQLTAAGGIPPYRWRIDKPGVNGRLPKGLALNPSTGLITGTPNERATTSTFVVQAADVARPKGRSTATFTITVT